MNLDVPVLHILGRLLKAKVEREQKARSTMEIEDRRPKTPPSPFTFADLQHMVGEVVEGTASGDAYLVVIADGDGCASHHRLVRLRDSRLMSLHLTAGGQHRYVGVPKSRVVLEAG